jgi:hypothetical protein
VYGVLVQKFTSGLEDPVSVEKLELRNYPNPFANTTTFSFNLPFRTKVTLKIYDGCAGKTFSNRD